MTSSCPFLRLRQSRPRHAIDGAAGAPDDEPLQSTRCHSLAEDLEAQRAHVVQQILSDEDGGTPVSVQHRGSMIASDFDTVQPYCTSR